MGGFDKVRGMPVDWSNFRRGMNLFIGERDAQMLVDKMTKRQQHVPEFSFYHHTVEKKLCRMFWADETMKCNYVAFGDVVAFDATFDTNKCVPLHVYFLFYLSIYSYKRKIITNSDIVTNVFFFTIYRYSMVFVPFTGVDHNQKCVTFGAALLSDETSASYCWMLECFLKTHGKQPPLALTDQDVALRKAVVKMFPDSHHRLCMWHIT